MTFLNLAITAFLASVLVPILIHLFNRRSAKVVEWGAMQFLTGSLVSRKRKILLEEMLLLSLRCLLLALLVLALARPFFSAGSGLAWAIALPAVLLGTVALAVGTAFWQYAKWRNIFWSVGTTLLIVACCAIFLQRWFNPSGQEAVAERDVVIIIDGSTSMKVQAVNENDPDAPKQSNFKRAVDEARRIIAQLDQAAATSIILAGPTPNPRTLNPIYDRKELNDILDSLKPTDGRMNVHDAIKAAALVLANGHNPHKQIIILTDEQNAGWEPQNTPAWQYVEDMLARFPLKPSVYARFYDHPEDYNNVAVTRAEPGRSIVGTDRPLAFDVHLENTGKGPTSPGALQLWVDGEKVQELPLRLLESGGSDSIRLSHQFDSTGAHVVQVVAAVNDHLPADNKATRVVYVMDKLPVLLVEGNPDPDPWRSSAQFMRVALAPGMQEATQTQREFLVDAKVIEAPQIVSIKDFSGYSAVVLANVPRLPASTAHALSDYVRNGGGVLIAPGDRVDTKFYNSWVNTDGAPMTPGLLSTRRVVEADVQPARLEVSSLGHETMAVLIDGGRHDLQTVRVMRHWRLDARTNDESVVSGGALANGDPFLLQRKIGKGHVLMTAVSLDGQGSNLASRRSFVPLVHELVYFLADPAHVQLNQRPYSDLTLTLPIVQSEKEKSEIAVQGRLRGTYYKDRQMGELVATRDDMRLHDALRHRPTGVPEKNFSVRWDGSLMAPKTGSYKFYVRADEFVSISIDGQVVASTKGKNRQARGDVNLEAGRRHNLRIEYVHAEKYPSINIDWEVKGIGRRRLEHGQYMKLSTIRSSQALDADRAFSLVAPDGSVRTPKPEKVGRFYAVKVGRPPIPGLYHVNLSADLSKDLGHMMGPEMTIPFTVVDESVEGRFVALDDEAIATVSSHTGMKSVASSDVLVKLLLGENLGTEVWRYLALVALVVLLGEVALTRWIAHQRRLNQVEAVSFERQGATTMAFQEQLTRMRPEDAAEPQEEVVS